MFLEARRTMAAVPRRLVLLAVAAAILCFAAAVPGFAVRSGGSTKVVTGWITALAMDGSNVVYSADNDRTFCENVVEWNVVRRLAVLVNGRTSGTCGDDRPSGQRVTALAVAGRQVAWIREIGGNTEIDQYLFTTTVAGGKAPLLASAQQLGDPPSHGTSLGGLAGSGNLLVVDKWASGTAGLVADASLRSIAGVRLTTIATGRNVIVSESVDQGRIAVLRQDGSVGLYTAKGKPTLAITPTSAKEIALRKGYLVVLTKTRTLEIYNSATGKLIRTLTIPGGAAHLDVYANTAVFAVWRKLYAVQLTTGKSAVVASARRAIVSDQLEAPGLVYAYNTVRGIREVGNLVFVPLQTVKGDVS
jgi:hypothetical protein